MKFKNTSTNSIVLINEQTGITLKSVTNNTVIYKIQFQVDLNEAARRNNAFTGKVYFSKVARQITQPIFSKDRNGDEATINNPQPRPRTIDGSESLLTGNNQAIGNQILIDEILEINNRRRRTVRRNDENILQTLNFSMFDFVSRESIEQAKSNTYESTEKVLTSEVFENLKDIPIFERLPPRQLGDLSQVGQLNQTLSNQTIRNEMRNAVARNVDPASLVVRTQGIVSAVKSIGGISSTSRIPDSTDNASSIIGRALNLSSTVLKDSVVSDTSFLTKDSINITSKVLVTLDFAINTNILSGVSTIYFEIELNDDAQRPVYNKLISINHAKNLDEFLVPRFAPEITSYYRRAGDYKLVLFLRQIDPIASFVLLYYKEFPNDNDYSNPYVFLGKVPVTREDGEVKVEITKNLHKKTFIRAIACSAQEKRGLLFNSIAVDPSKLENFNFNSTLISSPIVIWNYSFNTNNSIIINGTVQFLDPVGVTVTRKQNSDLAEEYTIFGPYFLNGLTDFSFTDNEASVGKTYIYNAYITSRDGIVRKALDNLIVFNTEIKNNEISTQIIEANNVVNGESLNVTFNLVSNLNRQNSKFILENFRKQGIYDLFKEIFTVEDAPVSYAYKVLRKNLTTGEEEDFGILPSLEFNDSFLGRIKNVKPLQAGYSYKYSVYTFLRTPDSLLPQLVATGSYRGKEYTYLPYYTNNPFVLQSGTMVTEITLREQHTNSEYSFGPTGQVIEHNADFSDVMPVIKNVVATNKSRTENILQWKVEGNLDKIDHFIISTLQLSHMRTVGKVHNISETNSFTFYDILTDGESGDLSYVIKPIYFNYDPGQEVKSNTIIV